ncbi:MAG: hypothetical protein H0V66_02935 [Bdellovibrionales bacterium]|nr:hypothetical protein [Bdellovibrionales bacterium]
MKSRNDELTQRVLMLLKIDANNVFKRIKSRKSEYLEIFALRRTREHFPKIFDNRYEDTTLENLIHCSTELITTLDQFYTPVEEMKWYLFKTEDMPNTVEDFIDRKISKMEKLLATLNLYLDAELGIQNDEPVSIDQPLFIDQTDVIENDFSINLEDDNSQET